MILQYMVGTSGTSDMSDMYGTYDACIYPPAIFT